MNIKYELLCSTVEKLADKLNEEMPKDFYIDELGLRYPLVLSAILLNRIRELEAEVEKLKKKEEIKE